MTSIEFNAAFLVAAGKGRAPAELKAPRISVHADRRARRLALAYLIERLIEQGTLRDYAHAAQRLGVSRARLTQIQDSLLLPVERQEQLLTATRCDASKDKP